MAWCNKLLDECFENLLMLKANVKAKRNMNSKK